MTKQLNKKTNKLQLQNKNSSNNSLLFNKKHLQSLQYKTKKVNNLLKQVTINNNNNNNYYRRKSKNKKKRYFS